MQYSKFSKTFALSVGVLAMVFLISLIVRAAVWNEPSATPPGGNVPPPLRSESSDLNLAGATWSERNVININQLTGNNDIYLRSNSGENAPVYIAGSQLSFYSGGSEKWRIDSTGNLTVGSVPWARLTSFPSDCSPGQYVYGVGGTLKCSSPSVGAVSSVSNSNGTLTISPTTGAVVASLNLAHTNTWTGSQTFSANTNFPGSGIWNTSGNVGIGTAGPGQKLDVAGGYIRSDTGFCIGGSCITSWSTGGGGIGGSGTANYVAKFTAGTTIGNSQIYDNGTNVGIGTPSPDANYKLTTSGGGVKAENATAQPAGYFSSTGGGKAIQTGSGQILFGSLTSCPNLKTDASGLLSCNTTSYGAVSSVSNSDGTLTIFPTTGAVVASLNLTHTNTWTGSQTFSANTYFPGSGIWNTSGNVGIGTSPSYKLDVSGDVRWTGTLQGGSVPWARLISFPSSCPSGQYVSAVGSALTCSTPAAAGDITAVYAGSGLTGGGIAGDVTLSADTNYLQKRVTGSCSTAGYSIKTIDINGNVTCEYDDVGITSETDPQVGTLWNGYWCTSDGSQVNCTNSAPGGGGVTSITAGNGLIGGGTGAVTLNVTAGAGISAYSDSIGLTYPSKSCSSGYAIQSLDLSSSYSPTCVPVGGGSNDFDSIYVNTIYFKSDPNGAYSSLNSASKYRKACAFCLSCGGYWPNEMGRIGCYIDNNGTHGDQNYKAYGYSCSGSLSSYTGCFSVNLCCKD